MVNYRLWIFRTNIIVYSIFLFIGVSKYSHAVLTSYSSKILYNAALNFFLATLSFLVAMSYIYPKIRGKSSIVLIAIMTFFMIVLIVQTASSGNIWEFVFLIIIILQFLIFNKIYKSTTGKYSILNILLLLFGLTGYILQLLLCSSIILFLAAFFLFYPLITLWALGNIVNCINLAIKVKNI